MSYVDTEQVSKWLDRWKGYLDEDSIMRMKYRIIDIPTADVTEVKWIPCDEELPENEVLCCNVYGDMIIGDIGIYGNSDTGFTAENEHDVLYNCIAWMPLPKPYSEVE